jgi:hypothetical protein
MMNEKKLKERLNVYGADLMRWPEDEVPQVRALLADSPTARDIYRQADNLDRALDNFAPPPVPAGLAVRAANEALLRARAPQKTSAGFRFPPLFRPMPAMGAGVFALASFLLLALPQARDPVDVGQFIQSMDKLASRTDQDIKEADEVIGLLASANDQSGVTSDELMNTLFGDDSQDGKSL